MGMEDRTTRSSTNSRSPSKQMEYENDAYDHSSEDEVEFQGRGQDLGEWQVAEIADHEEEEVEADEHNFQQPLNLPAVPAFHPYEHRELRHDRVLHFPTELFQAHQFNLNPLRFFMLFFDKEQFKQLAYNTNEYATQKEQEGKGEGGGMV
ncbi:hypothetical protein HOY82DRAFT_536798 [Tuber indicum]|nr:hypothetical protein HOY82DRAFT_536798 [Tuber indicum]